MRHAAATAFAVFLLAAAPAPLAGQAPDRSHPPAVGPAPVLRLPPVERRTLSNGLPVIVMTMHKVPTVDVELVVRAGAMDDPAGKFGLASMTAAMLDEGAGSRTALQIADAVDYLGADLTSQATSDASYINLHVPVARLDEALALMADVTARPTFPEAELKRRREETLTALLQAQDDPEQLIDFAFPRVVYGTTHRYGTGTVGTAASLQGIGVADLKAFYATHYHPADAAVIVTGDVTADTIVPALERTLGQWKPSTPRTAQAAVASAPQLTGRHVYLIDKPDAAQSQIRIGWIGVPRSTPDYFSLRVLNTILGEPFSSRLNHNLREVHGYTYGAGSRFDMRLGAGPFYATAGVQTDKTAEALREFFNELTRIHEPIPAAELDKAKNYLSLLLPSNFETTRSSAAALANAFVFGLPPDYFDAYGSHVAAVTAADVTRATTRYIQPDKFAIVIVGDRKKIEAGVRALNLGPVTIVEPAAIFR